MSRTVRFASILAAALAAGGLGCTRANPEYCDPAVPSACGPEQSCNPDTNRCEPTGGPVDGGHDGSRDGPRADGPGDAAFDTAPECQQSSDCTDPTKPICTAGACQPCGGDSECLARDPSLPACVSGQCYECSTYLHCTTAGKPLCSVDHACVPCQSDRECKDGPEPTVGVCVAGDCPDTDSVLWVDAAASDCIGADGSAAKPFCGLTAAMTAAKTDSRKTIVVKPGSYAWAAIKDAALAGVVVVGWNDGAGGQAVVSGDPTHPAIDISLAGTVTLRRLHLKGGNATGAVLQCSTAACTAEDLEVESGGIGVKAIGASPLTLRRSRVHNNSAGGVLVVTSSSFVIENNFVYSNGTLASLLGGVYFDASYQTKRLVNNTLFNNASSPGVGPAVHCDVGDIEVANNIMWMNRDSGGVTAVNLSSGVPVCTVVYGVIDDTAIAQAAGAHNTDGDPLFQNGDAPPYNLHLSVGSSALGTADPSVAPPDDIDGQLRPVGGPTDIGADQME